MNGERHIGLTGLEQYSWERAGYFIRRRAVDADLIAAAQVACERAATAEVGDARTGTECADACGAIANTVTVRAIARDLVPQAVLLHALIRISGGVKRTEWRRGVPLDTSLPAARQAAILHALTPAATFEVALATHEAFLVVPGSHIEPLSEQQSAMLSADPFCDLPGAVRIRLDAGDALVIGSGVLRREDPHPGSREQSVSLPFVSNVD